MNQWVISPMTGWVKENGYLLITEFFSFDNRVIFIKTWDELITPYQIKMKLKVKV